jgi:DNA-directed RNA polymerase subunit L
VNPAVVFLELKLKAKDDKSWEVTFDGAERSIGDMIVDELHKNPDVAFAACVVEHPVVARSPKIVLRTKSKKARAALAKAVEAASEKISDFKAKAKRIREKS